MQFAIYMKTANTFLGEGWLGKGDEVGSLEARVLFTVREMAETLPMLVWHDIEEVKIVRIS